MSSPDPVPQPPFLKKPELLPGWQRCYRWFSTQSMATGIGVQASYMLLDDAQKAAIGHRTVLIITIVVLVLGMIGNVIKQNFSDK